MKNKIFSSLTVASLFIFFAAHAIADDEIEENNEHDGKKVYSLKAKDAHLVRHVTGPIMESIRGVPAIPVDSFDWSGENIVDIQGKARLNIDPVSNTGEIVARWRDEYGHWTYHQKMFVAPPHPTGVKIGSSIMTTLKITGDPVTTNIYLHGDTGAGAPVIPTVFNLLSTWGPAKVTLNDEIFPNTYDGTRMWPGHTMISESVRDAGGSVRTTSGEIYNMSKKADGITYPENLTFHIVFHSMPGSEMTGNIPPPVSFFYHISFSDIKLKIKHKP